MPAVLRAPSWGGKQPPEGTPINWGHALSIGLVGCWPFNEQGGGRLVTGGAGGIIAHNVVNEADSLKTKAITDSNVQWRTAPVTGETGFFPGSGGGIVEANAVTIAGGPASSLLQPPEVTLFWRGYFFGAAANAGAPFLIGMRTTALAYAILCRSNSALGFDWDDSGTTRSFNGPVFTQLLPFSATLTVRAGSALGFINGVRTALNSTLASVITYSGTPIIEMDSGANAITTFAAVYNRAMNPGEVLRLATEPYAMFAPPGPQPFYVGFGTSSGPVTHNGTGTIAGGGVIASSGEVDGTGAVNGGGVIVGAGVRTAVGAGAINGGFAMSGAGGGGTHGTKHFNQDRGGAIPT